MRGSDAVGAVGSSRGLPTEFEFDDDEDGILEEIEQLGDDFDEGPAGGHLEPSELGAYNLDDPKPDPDWNPSPEEIRWACRQIQAGWSRDERRKRAAYRGGESDPRWVPPGAPALPRVERRVRQTLSRSAKRYLREFATLWAEFRAIVPRAAG